MVASAGRSTTCRIDRATVSGRISRAASYTLFSCSWTLSCMGVSVRPGNTVVTRTPCEDSSCRRISAKPRTPDFEATYADRPAASGDRVAVKLAIRTKPLALRRAGSSARVRIIGAIMLTLICSKICPAASSAEAEIDDGGDVEQAVEQPRQNDAEQCHFKRGWVLRGRRPGSRPAGTFAIVSVPAPRCVPKARGRHRGHRA